MLRLACIAIALIGAVSLAAAQSRGVVVMQPADAETPVTLYGSSHALVIGIDAYRNGWPRLANAVEDAGEVAHGLEAQGFDVMLKTDLDANALEGAIEDFVYDKGQDPEARLLIWFAGHGHMVGEEAYLVPADAPSPQQDGQFRRKALSMRDFGKFMREVRSKHVLAIFDSCFSGNVFQSTRAALSPSITRATGAPVRQIISSGDAGQVVSDDGAFRKLFLAALAGDEPTADANRDGFITGSELGLFLTDKVTSLSNNRQTPRFGALRELELDRGDFVFQLPNGATGQAAPTPVAIVAPPPVAPKAPRPVEPPSAERVLELSGNETIQLMEGRLAFTMLKTPYGARRDLVGVGMNGQKKSMAIGNFVVARGSGGGCVITLTEILVGQNRAKFLMRCGGPPPEKLLSKARIDVVLGEIPEVSEAFTMTGGTTRNLASTSTLMTFIGTPYGARRDLVGVSIEGERFPMEVGDVRPIEDGGRTCGLTVTRIHVGQKKADFLLRCD